MNYYLKKIALGLLFLGIYGVVYCQSPTVDLTEGRLMFKDASATIEAEGSPYILEEFQALTIKQYTGKVYSGRYNAYNGEMEVKLADGKIIALDNKSDFELIFTSINKIYRTYEYTDENFNSKRGFLVVLKETSDFVLLKGESISFYEKVEASSSYDKSKPAKFKRDEDMYYLSNNDEVKVLSQNKKQFLNTFPKHANKLKSFMKKNKLNPKNENDLVKLIEYLSTL